MRWIKRLLGLVVVLAGLGLAGFWLFGPRIADQMMNVTREHAPWPVSAEARALHDTLVVGDWHADPLMWDRDLNQRGDYGHVDIPRLIEGNVAFQVFTAVTKSPSGLNYEENAADARDDITLVAFGSLWPARTWTSIFERAVYQAEKLHGFAAASDGRLIVVKSAADLDRVLAAKASGEAVVGGILGIEGGHALEGDFANFEKLVDAGYRLFGLQHFFDNELGGSLHGQGNHGLTEFGRQVVEAIAAGPYILDVAHSSEAVTREVLTMTDMPIVLSHTGLHSVCEVKRNYPDDLMREIAATGGVIGIGYWEDVTCDDSPAGIARVVKAAIAAVGENHVSLGSDYDGSVTTSFDTSELAALTQALMDEGISEAQIRKVMGENMLRVLRARLGG
jgi:membrane dipeptidase